MVPILSPSFLLAAAPPPAFHPSRLGCPARCLFAGRGRGVQRVSGGPPFLESPGTERNPGRRWGGGPVDLQASTPRDQHPEVDSAPWVQMRARSIWLVGGSP